MIKTVAKFEHTIEGRVFHFICENDSPLTHVKDALMKFVQYAGQIEDQAEAAKKAQAEKAAEAPVEPPKEG